MTGLGAVTLGSALSGLLLGLALLMPAHIFGATGAGDVKLLAAFGALLGPADVFDAFLRAAILGGVIALTSRCGAAGCAKRCTGRQCW
jgi:prepilin peptidase CpaA